MADVKQEIQARQNELNELISAQKNDEAINYYTDDCVMMASGQEIVHGKEGLKKLSKSMAALQSQIGKIEATIEEVFGDGDVVTSRGKGTTYTKDGSILLQTKAVGVWKKVDGKWLIHNYIWNTDKPMRLSA